MNYNNKQDFYSLMNMLEKYIEEVGYFSDWEQRKQIQNNIVKRKKTDLRTFASRLNGSVIYAEISNTPMKQEKEQLYKWIDATKINKDDCPEELKLLFYGMNEVIEGRTEKIEYEVENRKYELDPDSPEFQEEVEKAFSFAAKNLGVQIEVREFNGNAEKGVQTFQEIIESVSPTDYENFRWLPQKEEVPLDGSLTAQVTVEQLQGLLDHAEQEIGKKDTDNWEAIENLILELEEFKNNSTAHEGKNNYAWLKLGGGRKLSDLKLAVRIRDFRKDHPVYLPKDKQEGEGVRTSKNNTNYWIIGISVVAPVLLAIAIVAGKRRKNKTI